jgi:hypothetical protein
MFVFSVVFVQINFLVSVCLLKNQDWLVGSGMFMP